MLDENNELLYEEEEQEETVKPLNLSKTFSKNKNQNLKSNPATKNTQKGDLTEDEFKEAHKILNDEDEFAQSTANMKEKFNTLQSFNKSLRLNQTKGLDKAAREDEEEYYLDDNFEKETSTIKTTLNTAPLKTSLGNNSESMNENDRKSFSKPPVEKLRLPEKNLKERPQSKNSKNNKTFDDATNVFDKSAEFAVRESNETERRRQLNSSFEKPQSNGFFLTEQRHSKQPSQPRSQQSNGRQSRLKSSGTDALANKDDRALLKEPYKKPLEGDRGHQQLPHQTPSIKEKDYKMPNINQNSEGRQLKHAEGYVKHRSTSPFLKQQPKPSHLDVEKIEQSLQRQKTYSKDEHTRATMNPTPYSDKVAIVLTTDVRKRSEQVTFAQNTAIRHMIRELNEDLAKLIMRQIYDPNDILQERNPRLSPSPPKKIKEMVQDISVNQRVIELQNQEISKLEAKVNRVGSATHYMTLNEKTDKVKDRIKQLKLEKRKRENEFKKDLYQGRGRYFLDSDRRDEEALNKEYLDKRMKLGRMKGEFERLERQNSDAVQFIDEQKHYIEELQNRLQKLFQLAEHYQVKISNDYAGDDDGKPKSEKKKELIHRLELLKSLIPNLEKNYLNQNEVIKKDLHDTRAALKKETVMLHEMKRKQKEIRLEIQGKLNQKELDKQTLLKMKKIMQDSKKEDEDGAFYEEILDLSYDNLNISAIIEGSNHGSVKSKRQITLEIAHLATSKKVLKKKNAQKIADPPSTNLNTARSRGKESVPANRHSDKDKPKSSEKVAQPKTKTNTDYQETRQFSSKPTFTLKKIPAQGESEGFNVTLSGDNNRKEIQSELTDRRAKNVSPVLSEDKNSKPQANNAVVTQNKLDTKSEVPEPKNSKSDVVTSGQESVEKTRQSNEDKPKENSEKTETDSNKNPFKKPAFTLRGRGKIQENSSNDQAPQNNSTNVENKDLKSSDAKPKADISEPSINKSENEKKTEPQALKLQEQSNELKLTLNKPLELRIPETKPNPEQEKLNSVNPDKQKPNSKPEALTLNFESSEAKKLPANEKEEFDTKKTPFGNSEPLVLNLEGNSRLRTFKGPNVDNQNNSYLQMLSTEPPKSQESLPNKQLVLPQSDVIKAQETTSTTTAQKNDENNNPIGLSKNQVTDTDKKKEPIMPTKPKVEENDAPFGFIASQDSRLKIKKEEPSAENKNPNPFQFQPQQPVRLNIGNSGGVSNLRFRQNDLAKPLTIAEKPINNSDIMSVDLNSQKPASKNETRKSNIIDFDLDLSHQANISSEKPLNLQLKQADSTNIADPFANAGNIDKINFGEKKGLFDKKRDETPNRVAQNDPLWLKSSIEASKPKANEKSEFSWMKDSSSLKDSNTDRVFKFGEDESKPRLQEPKQTSELSFLSQLKEDNKKEIPTILAEDNTSKKPRLKMSVTSNETKKNREYSSAKLIMQIMAFLRTWTCSDRTSRRFIRKKTYLGSIKK